MLVHITKCNLGASRNLGGGYLPPLNSSKLIKVKILLFSSTCSDCKCPGLRLRTSTGVAEGRGVRGMGAGDKGVPGMGVQRGAFARSERPGHEVLLLAVGDPKDAHLLHSQLEAFFINADG